MKESKVIVFEYNSKFMDVYKLICFSENLKKYKQNNEFFKIVFYGDYEDEELAVNIAYFNKLVNEKVCDFAISFKTKNIIFENGINNKQIATAVTNINSSNFQGFQDIIKEYYQNEENVKIIVKSNDCWESIFSDIID